MTFLRIDHVQLAYPPESEAAARAFYVQVLGFCEVEKPTPLRLRGGLWFEAGRVGIHLGVEPDMRPSQKMHPALVVSDLDAVVARLVAAGAAWRPADELPGIRRGHTRDPFGNRLELIQGAIAR